MVPSTCSRKIAIVAVVRECRSFLMCSRQKIENEELHKDFPTQPQNRVVQALSKGHRAGLRSCPIDGSSVCCGCSEPRPFPHC